MSFRTGDVTRPGARQPAGFYGWRIVAVCVVLQGLTGPGQTAGVSVFIDPMIDELGITRSAISGSYLIGTLAGALGLPYLGRLLDAKGPRRTAFLVSAAFGIVLLGMSGVNGLVTLTLGFVGIRMLGQGGLSLVATTAPARWFDDQRGTAIGITTAAGAGLHSMFPIASAAIILAVGWRTTWVALALLIWLVIFPLARWALVNDPQDLGQRMDGNLKRRASRKRGDSSDEADDAAPVPTSMSRSDAMRTPIFWILTAGVTTTSMIATGLMFHQIDLLGEQGLTPIEAAANFLPQTISALAATLLAGSLIDKVRQRTILAGSMAMLAAPMIMVFAVSPGLSAIVYGSALGAAQGAMRTTENASYPKLFGIAHIGEIRGIARGFAVAGSAFGPLAFSLGFSSTGSYVQVILLLLSLPVAVLILSLFVAEPRPRQ